MMEDVMVEVPLADEIVFNVKAKANMTSPEERRSQKGQSDEIVFNRRKRTLSPEKYKELEEIYSKVAVHDFNDEFHLSEEERQKKFRYYEVFARLNKCKRKFRKLDEYVKVFRLCLDALQIVAEDNGIYNPEKFMKMVLKGQIKVYGLNFPKYIGKDKKDINWEYISNFIVDTSRDPEELSEKKKSRIKEPDECDDEQYQRDLFGDEMYEKLMGIIKSNSDDEGDEIFMPYYDDGTDVDRDNVVVEADTKDTKDLIKLVPEVVKVARTAIKEERLRKMKSERLNSFIFNMNEDDYDYISQLDSERGYHYDSDVPVFKGDIMNSKDYKKFIMAVDAYEDEYVKENYHGKMRTRAEIREIELIDTLEAAGWNIRNLYKNKEKEKKLKKAYKKDKKREEELKNKLLALQDRNKKRSKKSGIEFDSRKGKKGKKKNKDKKSKKESD
jgi:hypothetical protein